ncbi:GIY-YIG nuclease family protein [Phenylobacterium sp.]|uniref:GIY-YIG nuclease family protein n=1 Tax=Phenylobacterium sp. TaxID=1871053 RepID=UPI0035265811
MRTPEEVDRLLDEWRALAWAKAGAEAANRSSRRVQTRPGVRFVYFLQQGTWPGLIKIGVANNVAHRKASLERELGSRLRLLGIMRWRNLYPAEDGQFEGWGYLPWQSGRGGTALVAERLLHEMFSSHRVDRRRGQPWNAKHEWFRPSRRLMNFILTHAVQLVNADAAPIHELVFVPAESVQLGLDVNPVLVRKAVLDLPKNLRQAGGDHCNA